MDRQRSIATPVRTLTGAFACCEPQLRSLNIPAGTDVIIGLGRAANVGKSTVFNLLTGLRTLATGPARRWASRRLPKRSVPLAIVDLPGTYA